MANGTDARAVAEMTVKSLVSLGHSPADALATARELVEGLFWIAASRNERPEAARAIAIYEALATVEA